MCCMQFTNIKVDDRFIQCVADKPPIEELHQFLEFQLPRQWAPVYSDHPLGPQRKKQSSASLPLSFMGPRLYVCTNMVPLFLWLHQFILHTLSLCMILLFILATSHEVLLCNVTRKKNKYLR